MSRRKFEPRHKGLDLFSALCSDEGMQFIDYDRADGLSKRRYRSSFINEQCFQGLGSDNENSRHVF
jgi:hypothetical protein